MSSLTADEDQRWIPTHVLVTVLRGRGLRAKGKHGTSDVYTIIQVGKEKYSTCVLEKTTSPEWKEECSFELLPGVLEDEERSAYPPGSSDLVLTVMHRAVIGMDVFLGQAVIPLDKAFQDNICMRNEWFKLNSKTGKKEKERGDVQVTVQFTRNNLTASMYDLAMRDKHRSTFGKLKDRMRGKKRANDEDSLSAVVPAAIRHRLPSDGGGEEDYEDDEGGEGRRSKMRNFFLRGKLRKSSDTRSSTSLGSESSESSSRGGSLSPTAGISVVVSDLSNSPSNSSNLTADNSPEHMSDFSPKLASHECEFRDESGDITIHVPHPSVNGGHTYHSQSLDLGSGKPVGPVGQLQKSLALSLSLQNLRPPRIEEEVLPKGPAGDGRRWSLDKAGEEEKAAIAAALEQCGPMRGDEEEEEEEEVSVVSESNSQGKKGKQQQKKNVFSPAGGRGSPGGGGAQRKVHSEEKSRGWFGSKDSHSKPSLLGVTASLEPPPPLHPPSAPVLTPPPLHHTNPFSPPSVMSASNPFYSLVQSNPFYGEMLLTASPSIKPALPSPCLPVCFPSPPLSSSSTSYSSRSSNCNPTLSRDCLAPDNDLDNDPLEVRKEDVSRKQRPLPPIPPVLPDGTSLLTKTLSNPFTWQSEGGPGVAAEKEEEKKKKEEEEEKWDESFEEFAAGRLQSPQEVTSDYRAKQPNNTSTAPLETHSGSKAKELFANMINTNLTLNRNSALHSPSLDSTANVYSKAHFSTDKLSVLSEADEETTESELNQRHKESPVPFSQLTDIIQSHTSPGTGDRQSIPTDAHSWVRSIEKGYSLDSILANTTTNAACVTTSNPHQAAHHNHLSKASSPPCLRLNHEDNNNNHEDNNNKDNHNNSDSCSPVLGSAEGRCSVTPHTGFGKLEAVPEPSEETKAKQTAILDRVVGLQRECQSHDSILNRSDSEDKVTGKSDCIFETQGDCVLAQSDDKGQSSSSVLQKGIMVTGNDVTLSQSSGLTDFPFSDFDFKSLVSLHLAQENGKKQPCDFKEPTRDFLEEDSYQILDHSISNVNSSAIKPAILDSERNSPPPPFYIRTSSPEEHSTSSCVNPDVKVPLRCPPSKPPRLEFRQFLDSGPVAPRTSQNPASDWLSRDVSALPGLYESDDSQLYHTCLSSHSSRCPDVTEEEEEEEEEEEVVQMERIEGPTLPSANSTLCEEGVSDTAASSGAVALAMDRLTPSGAVALAMDRLTPSGAVALAMDRLTHGDGVSHSGGLSVDEDRTTIVQPHTVTEEPFLDFMFSAPYTDSVKSCADVTDGEGGRALLGSDDITQGGGVSLQRSLSEGSIKISSEDLTPSFGSDPGITQASSSNTSLLDNSSTSSLGPASFPIPEHAVGMRSQSSPDPTATAPPLFTAQPMSDAQHAVLPRETLQQAANQQNSPHPVRPLTPEEKRMEGRSVLSSGLEKLKSTIHPGKTNQTSEQEAERKKVLTEGAGAYYHLNHNELVTLLLQREAELQRQKAEFEHQGVLLVKREAELKKLKPQVRDLEDYIDTLLVRIMEGSPTLLQVRTAKLK